MKLQYAEVTIQKELASWRLLDCNTDFLTMTGFTQKDLADRFQSQFMKMLSVADISKADELFSLPTSHSPLYPWIFMLICAEAERTLPVLLQPLENFEGILRVRVHDASFLGDQTEAMTRRIISLEQSIPSGLCQVLFDEAFTILWHNDYFLEMLGYTEEQFTNELQYKATGYINPEDAFRIVQMLKDAMRMHRRMFTTEMHVTRRDGESLILLTSFSFTDEVMKGYPVLYSMGIDITSQKRAQELELDKERLRVAMEQASSYVLEYEVPERRLLSSDFLQIYFKLNGNVENAPETLATSSMIMEDSVQILRNLFDEIAQGAERTECVICLRNQLETDEAIWFRVRVTTIFDDANRPAKAILLMADITEHYNIEMRYREEEKRRAAMTYDMDFSCQIDLTAGKILSANEEKFPHFNFRKSSSSSELIRRNASNIVHPDDRADYLKKLSNSNMLELFDHGILEMTLDFRVLNPNNDGYHWCRGLTHFIKEPTHGHVCAYIYTKDIEEEKKNEIELRRHAEQDALTGLYNRYTIELYCDKSLENLAENSLSVIYMLDLDNFKYLNDTYGHFQGDEMLRQVAQALRNIFGANALLGRLGGDELVVFQPNCLSREAATQTAQQLCDTLQTLVAGEGVVTASIGLAFAPDDGRTFSELYHCSDAALYQAKRRGKNQWIVYEKANIAATEAGMLEERLSVSREWLLEEASDLIYVSDFYSYDMLYMNQEARKIYGVQDTTEYVGQKCYKLLQNQDHPCDFCTSHMLCRERFYSWEFRNTYLNKSFILRDRIVDWYGKPARIEFATDISVMDRRNQALEEQIEIDHAIISCLRILSGAQIFESAVEPMLRRLAEFYEADRAYILDYDAQRNLLQIRNEWQKRRTRSLRQAFGTGGITPPKRMHNCLIHHKNFIMDNNQPTPDHSERYYKLMREMDVCTQRVVPFYVSGQPAGLIGLDNPATYMDEMTVLETLGYFIAEELSRSKLSERLTFLGYHDSLTGLWNRNRYVEYQNDLQASAAHSLGVAVADLNALKEINKLRGHAQGDLVVKRAAELLKRSFPDALIFRLSGDEFVVHSENLSRAAFLNQVKYVKDHASSLQAHGISIGYAWSDQEIDCQQLTMQATDVMMMQKREYYQHEKEVHASGKHNHARLQELLSQIRNGCFCMYLQPKANCADFMLSGAEALVRLEPPEGGLVSPDQFIPTLEQEHMIQYIDLFMYEQVCKLLARWNAENRPLLTVSLNFSRQTVLEPDLLNTLLSLADHYQVPKERIEVEVTESLGDYESATIAEIGAGIKNAGFRLALDDFGSYYTNMAMLSSVPVDVLKLDRSLIRDVMYSHPNQLVLKSILMLCKDLGISSIAEGVETQEQLELLRALHCDEIQGYLFGRPIAVTEFENHYLHGNAKHSRYKIKNRLNFGT